MCHLGGRRALLAETLLRFARECAQDPPLAVVVARQDRPAAFHAAHTLKGAAGLLGLQQLQAEAALVEAQLAEAVGSWPDCGQLESALARAVAAIPALAQNVAAEK